MYSRLHTAAVALAATLLGCQFGTSEEGADPGLEGLALLDVQPRVLVPGTKLVVQGRSFAGEPWGTPWLALRGTTGDGAASIDVELPAHFVDFDRLELAVDADLIEELGGADLRFEGTAQVLIDSAVDGERHESPALAISLDVASELSPRLDSLRDEGVIFVNDWIDVAGDGLLLGGDEGQSFAMLDGCFIPSGGGECLDVGVVQVPIEPASIFDRSRGRFAFAPNIAGIRAGYFQGTVSLENVHASGTVRTSEAADVAYDLTEPAVLAVDPGRVSLGRYLTVSGGGFVGGSPDASTVIQLVGTYQPDGGDPVGVDVIVVPEFVEGSTVRYLLGEDDALGQLLDVRYGTGTFSGELVPITSYRGDEVTGDSLAFSVSLEPVKQIVHLRFSPQYVATLQHFGLRAMDAEIRKRVVAVVERDYAGVNLEVRTTEPTDYALYSEVEIGGADPNGLGLLGYDNTPGKDVGNQRLHDRIGGVNATTQHDGYPGYGGVFIESFFTFSEHPGEHATSGAMGESFDDIFDPFRPDRDGDPVRAVDLQDGVPSVTDGQGCPASDRAGRIACATFVLGNLIGTTLSHEIGHSLGLANPGGVGFHYSSDADDRIMDAGGNRSFLERAEIGGLGPARFCTDAYDYLREILPSTDPADDAPRPSCQ